MTAANVARIGTVLVPVDGSPESERAVPVALALARARGGTVRAAHVFVPIGAAAARSDEENGMAVALEEALREESRVYVREAADRLATEAPGTEVDFIDAYGVRSPFGETARVVAALLLHAERWRVGLIVMTTHGRGGLSRAWLGSVADGITRESRIPLLLIRPATEPPRSGGFLRIVVPLDGSGAAEEAIPWALSLAAPAGAHITLVRVVTPRRVLARPAPVARVDAGALTLESEHAASELSMSVARISSECVTADTAVLVDERPARAILDLARHVGADLIAMSTHGRGGVRRLVLGSVADKVVRGADAAVLLIRPAAEGTADA
ncbi:MAG TPA: universal stress protein [Gemmatimonadaceae bacterium]|nr:universal stress protein [Gemmatimonadaceae bacterium]